MSTLTIDQFGAAVRDWAAQHNSKLKFHWTVKGGWEGWIQVDLTAYLLSLDSTLDILREQPIYQNNLKRVDLLLNANLPGGGPIPVEIKAESFDNQGNFISGVYEDVQKLRKERNVNFILCKCVMMAVCFDRESLKTLLGPPPMGCPPFVNLFEGEIAVVAAIL